MNKKTLVVSLIVASISLYVGWPFLIYGAPEKILELVSPDGQYRLEEYIPRYSPYAWLFRDPAFSKAYDVKTGECLGTSRIYEMDYIGTLHWPSPRLPYVSPAPDIEIPVPME